jgi:23S rRNA (uracil1939-C5)-methyltransferase
MTAELGLSEAKKAFLDAEVVPYMTGREVLVPPPCPYFGSCGGCHLQHLAYPDQLALKRRFLEECFRQRGMAVPDLEGRVFGMADPWFYRNKADFNAKTYGGQVRVGLTELGANRVLDVEQCAIASKPINECLAGFKKAFPDFPELKRKLHSLILRSSRSDDNVIALYHTKLKDVAIFNRLTAQVREAHPVLAGGGFVRKGAAVGEGQLSLHEEIRGMEYTYSASSFFQANPVQTEVLARLVEEHADPRPSDVVLDVYSGVGLFTLLIAQSVREVYAIEDTPRSVKDAIENARAAGLTNCHFIKGHAEAGLEQLYRTRLAPTLAIMDPPRSGCSEQALQLIRRMEVPRVVFVSCSPRSLARDVELMIANGYRLESLAVVDMFPQTIHLESVAYLTLA